MKYLITGGCGFVGSNLAKKVLDQGEDLFIMDNLFREGSYDNLNWLRTLGDFKYYPSDIRNSNDVEVIIKDIKPDIVFHLAGQVAMTTSISNPRLDFETNCLGTFNLLDAIKKHSPYSIVMYSSTNKVYGDFSELNFIENDTRYNCVDYPEGISESYPLNFHSPYGCSKGSADQYLLDYHRIYDLQTIVFRHSSMYGGNQNSTIDQGWVGWFVKKAIDIKLGLNDSRFTISGNGKQVRDVLHVDDVTDLYFQSIPEISKLKGNVFNIGGGISKSLSILELFEILEKLLNIKMTYSQLDWRESDQLVFVANTKKIRSMINWDAKINPDDGIKRFIKWINPTL
jgi:CDP-paratose 2-epimerase